MAIGQLSDLGGFVGILETYRLGGGITAAVLAPALVAGELLAGIGLLRSRTGHRPATMAVAVGATWTVLAALAFARGLDLPNCGCFGVHAGQPLRWWVLVEDAQFIALALWVRHRALETGSAHHVAEVTERTRETLS